MARTGKSRNNGGRQGNAFHANPSAPPIPRSEYNNQDGYDDRVVQPNAHGSQNEIGEFNYSRNRMEQGGEAKNVYDDFRNEYITPIAVCFSRREKALLRLTIVNAFLTFSRIIAGGVKLKSECDLEQRIAIYMFIKSWIAVFFWGTLAVLLFQSNMDTSFRNVFMQCYIGVDLLASIGLFVVGSIWLFGDFEEMKEKCPDKVDDWDVHFINVAMALTTFDYIILVIFLIFAGYILCDNKKTQVEDCNN